MGVTLRGLLGSLSTQVGHATGLRPPRCCSERAILPAGPVRFLSACWTQAQDSPSKHVIRFLLSPSWMQTPGPCHSHGPVLALDLNLKCILILHPPAREPGAALAPALLPW